MMSRMMMNPAAAALSRPMAMSDMIRDPFTMMARDPFFLQQQQLDTPPFDLMEKDKEFVIHGDLPGFSKEQVSIEYADNTLTVSGRKEETKENRDVTYWTRERFSTGFSRSFKLGAVDSAKIQAHFKNGVLTVNCPKSVNGPTQKRIEIKG